MILAIGPMNAASRRSATASSAGSIEWAAWRAGVDGCWGTAVGEGADVYHDNVGGQMLVDALAVLRPYGTVVLCGLITQYNTPDSERQFNFNLGLPIMKRAVMKGLVVYDFEPERAAFLDEVAPLVAAGKVRYLEDRVAGIERAGAHFARLMRGENVGKALVVLVPD